MKDEQIVELSKLVLMLITEGVKLLSDAHEGKIDPAEATKQVKAIKTQLHDRLADVNKRIAGEIDKKFDK